MKKLKILAGINGLVTAGITCVSSVVCPLPITIALVAATILCFCVLVNLFNIPESEPEVKEEPEQEKPKQKQIITRFELINNKTDHKYEIFTTNGFSLQCDFLQQGKVLQIKQKTDSENGFLEIGRYYDYSVNEVNWKTIETE